MDVVFNCPKCNQELEVDAAGIGQEIECPSCATTIKIPATAKPVPAPANGGDPGEPAAPRWGVSTVNAIASSAAAKVEKHLKVPVHNKPQAKLVTDAPVPLEVAAKISDRTLHIKTIKHGECVESGHNRFDEVVSKALEKIGEINIVSIHPISYSNIDVASQKLLSDFGVMIVYKA